MAARRVGREGSGKKNAGHNEHRAYEASLAPAALYPTGHGETAGRFGVWGVKDRVHGA